MTYRAALAAAHSRDQRLNAAAAAGSCGGGRRGGGGVGSFRLRLIRLTRHCLTMMMMMMMMMLWDSPERAPWFSAFDGG